MVIDIWTTVNRIYRRGMRERGVWWLVLPRSCEEGINGAAYVEALPVCVFEQSLSPTENRTNAGKQILAYRS